MPHGDLQVRVKGVQDPACSRHGRGIDTQSLSAVGMFSSENEPDEAAAARTPSLPPTCSFSLSLSLLSNTKYQTWRGTLKLKLHLGKIWSTVLVQEGPRVPGNSPGWSAGTPAGSSSATPRRPLGQKSNDRGNSSCKGG